MLCLTSVVKPKTNAMQPARPLFVACVAVAPIRKLSRVVESEFDLDGGWMQRAPGRPWLSSSNLHRASRDPTEEQQSTQLDHSTTIRLRLERRRLPVGNETRRPAEGSLLAGRWAPGGRELHIWESQQQVSKLMSERRALES